MKWYSRSSICVGLLILIVMAPPCEARDEAPFDYFRNSWSVIGLKDYEHGTRITPENELLVASRERPSEGKPMYTTVRFSYGKRLTPLSRMQTKTALDGWIPVILIRADDGWVRYDFSFWATPLPSVIDWKRAFDWPTEGENFLNWIRVKISNTGTGPAEAKLKMEQHENPKEGDGPNPSVAEVEEFAWTLAPGETKEWVLRIPWQAVADSSAFDSEDPNLWLDRTIGFWRGALAGAANIEVPCRKAREALLAAHICQLIANDHGQVHGGEGFYDEFYIRDGAYQVMELEEAGLEEAARKAIQSYLDYQREDGRFESQRGQLDANGQGPWALWQYYKITGDLGWLEEEAYPRMRRSVDWAMKARREAPADSPFEGLLPNAIADGEFLWGGEYHILGYDFWNLRALLCAADAAKALGRAEEAEELLQEADDYRAAIDRASQRIGVAHFPPSWEMEGTHWGNTETLWPTEIFPPDDPRVTALLKEVRENHGGGFLEGTIRWLGGANWKPPLQPGDAIHPYMSAYSTMASLIRGEHEKVVEEFYWYLLHSSATHAFPEGIFHKRRFAWSNTIPHVTGASNYALLLRHMLVHERGDELHLLSALPDWWLEEGQEIRVERAPTHFGVMNLVVWGTEKGVEVEFEAPKRQSPKRIVLHLPESRPLVGSAEGIEIVVRSDQEKKWDFPMVVDLYKKQAAPPE